MNKQVCARALPPLDTVKRIIPLLLYCMPHEAKHLHVGGGESLPRLLCRHPVKGTSRRKSHRFRAANIRRADRVRNVRIMAQDGIGKLAPRILKVLAVRCRTTGERQR